MKLRCDLRARVLLGVSMLMAMASATSHAGAESIANPERIRVLAATCGACHGTDGRAVQGEAMVVLAGYPKDAMVTRMRAFRDGSRASTVMQQIAKGYSDAQIESLAAYFSGASVRRP